MPFTLRVRDFQAIKDATIRVSGLTVVTGTNNSGKTSLMRAVRGVFTNAPAGPLVRLGTAHLTVDLAFDEGRTLTWEKGHDKPNGKGKAINRYIIDGKSLEGVGRGVPPEVEAFGVRAISAGSDEIWPQIARQFDGNLFLVDRPGSVVAEALSDVDRVGKLSDALRSSESDRRAVTSEIKIRRADCVRIQDRVKQFDGFDDAQTQITAAQIRLADLIAKQLELASLSDLAVRMQKARAQVASFAGFKGCEIPLAPSLFVSAWREASNLESRLGAARKSLQDHNLHVTVPIFDPPAQGLQELDSLRQLAARRKAALQNANLPSLLTVPNADRVAKYSKGLAILQDWTTRYSKGVSDIARLDKSLVFARAGHTQAAQEARDALHDMGSCPTCGVPT